MRLRNLFTLLALGLAALVVAGCGGGGGDSTSAPETTAAATTAPSKEELISRGDSICAEVNAAVGTVGANGEGEAGGGSQVGQVADLYIGMVESLKEIGAPEDSAGYSEFITSAEELSKVESEAKLADERGDSEALGAAETKAVGALESFESAAEAYGFEQCGKEPVAPAPKANPGTESSSSSPAEEEAAPEEVTPEEAAPEEAAPEEAAPEGGGAGAGGGEAPSEGSGGGSSGGVGPG